MNQLSCLVLAGGESKRFGGNKALYNFEGRTFLERAVGTALKVSDDIIVSVGEEKNISGYNNVLRGSLKNKNNINFISDDVRCRFKGPLRGIFSCFKFLQGDFVYVIECDAPYFNSFCVKIISGGLNGDISGVVPIWPDSTIEPLLACYKRTETIDILNRLHGYAVKVHLVLSDSVTLSRLLRVVRFYSIKDMIKTYPSIKPEFFININDKKNLEEYHAGDHNYPDITDMPENTGSVKIKRRNVFAPADDSVRQMGKQPYGWTAKGLYYMKLYKKSGKSAYLKKASYFFKEEAGFYNKKGLVFMASKIKDMLSSMLSSTLG